MNNEFFISFFLLIEVCGSGVVGDWKVGGVRAEICNFLLWLYPLEISNFLSWLYSVEICNFLLWWCYK